MRERPIIFSAPMVRAILSGRKTQTRRVCAPSNCYFGSAPESFWQHGDFEQAWVDGKGGGWEYLHVPAHSDAGCYPCLRWGWEGTSHRLWSRLAPPPVVATDEVVGDGTDKLYDRLWVRETWWHNDSIPGAEGVSYRADGEMPDHMRGTAWRSPIYMPRWASRLTLEVSGVRVQRVQEISAEDVEAEGVEYATRAGGPATFAGLWDSINAKRGHSWESNPWVWVVEFRRTEP